MIDFSKLKVGDYVWWTVERMFKSWSCPCEVIAIPDMLEEYPKITLKSLDDFKETELAIHGDSMSEEIKPCDKQDVLIYFLKRKTSYQISNIELATEIEKNKMMIEKITGIMEEMS